MDGPDKIPCLFEQLPHVFLSESNLKQVTYRRITASDYTLRNKGSISALVTLSF